MTAGEEGYESASLTASRKVKVTEEVVEPVRRRLLDTSLSMADRTRAIFTLRNLGGPLAVSALASAFGDESALLKHEVAYTLGQLQEASAVPVLEQVLADEGQETIVRHEAGEALGALGSLASLPLLRSFLGHEEADLRQTCELAVARIAWMQEEAEHARQEPSKFLSFDPAPPADDSRDTASLAQCLLDEEAPLFERYRALFGLRDRGGSEALAALARALLEAGSALLRHEVAFVLGQMSEPEATAALAQAAAREEESPMVRHEAIEALGELCPRQAEQELILRLADHSEAVVRESCAVALDLAHHNASGSFEYADALTPQ